MPSFPIGENRPYPRIVDSRRSDIRVVCGVVARNGAGELLLMRRADEGTWGLPGGGVEGGETWELAAKRECLEETGWTVRVTGVLGVYSDPETQTHTYPSGERVHFVGVVFTADAEFAGGPSDAEATEVRFFPVGDLPEPLFEPDRPVLADYVSRRATPVIG